MENFCLIILYNFQTKSLFLLCIVVCRWEMGKQLFLVKYIYNNEMCKCVLLLLCLQSLLIHWINNWKENK